MTVSRRSTNAAVCRFAIGVNVATAIRSNESEDWLVFSPGNTPPAEITD